MFDMRMARSTIYWSKAGSETLCYRTLLMAGSDTAYSAAGFLYHQQQIGVGSNQYPGFRIDPMIPSTTCVI